MKVWAVFRKTLLEQRRDLTSLLMVLLFCPFFAYLYWLMSGGGSTSYKILVINLDAGVQIEQRPVVNEADTVIQALRELKYQNDLPILKVDVMRDRAEAEERLRNRYASALLVLPEGFSAALHRYEPDIALTIVGDMGNPTYTIASVLALTAADQLVQEKTHYRPPVAWREEFISGNKACTEFEAYVPGLLILSIMMLVFTTALPLVREREAKTMRRLQLSSMNSFDLLTGVSLAQIIIGAGAVILTFYTAVLLGFHSIGPLWAAIVLGILTALSVIAVGLLTACFCKNATAVLTIGTFPFFLLMWFTGAAYPIPRVTLFTFGARQFALNDILPPTHAVIAMNKILSLGASLWDVLPEIGLMMGLTVIYFVVAVLIFRRVQMKGI